MQVPIPFAFPFYGTAQTAGFVNSDGNITLGEEDKSSVDRNVARMLTGPPRIALFFADLDPTQGTGKIFVNAAADQYTVTWCGVRGFDSTRTVTAQATLLPDGSVEIEVVTSRRAGPVAVLRSVAASGNAVWASRRAMDRDPAPWESGLPCNPTSISCRSPASSIRPIPTRTTSS
jgi:hypothetical protein